MQKRSQLQKHWKRWIDMHETKKQLEYPAKLKNNQPNKIRYARTLREAIEKAKIKKVYYKKQERKKLWKARFVEKQTWKAFFGGITEKQAKDFFFKFKTFEKAMVNQGQKVENILVDTGWARSPHQARKWVIEGRVTVGVFNPNYKNNVKIIKVNRPSFQIKPGDWLEGDQQMRELLVKPTIPWSTRLSQGIEIRENIPLIFNGFLSDKFQKKIPLNNAKIEEKDDKEKK
jgi:ribosomal protein S4